MKELTRVPFHDTTIYTTADGTYVALRPVCEALGLDVHSQRRRLQKQSWATEVMMTSVAADGKTREMTFIDRRTIPQALQPQALAVGPGRAHVVLRTGPRRR